MDNPNSFGAAAQLRVGSTEYQIFRLAALEEKGVAKISLLPFSTKILLENLLRMEDGEKVRAKDIQYVASGELGDAQEISFMPARVLLQDFTGVPCVVDLATMKVIAHYDLAGKGSGPAGLSLDAKNHILFACCRNPHVCVILNADDGKIITTRTIEDRLDTLAHARSAGLKVCCGGIVGMGEEVGDRLGMLMLLANLAVHPESVPINMWNEVKAVPVNDTAERPDPIALARLIAVARIMMPKSVVRMSAGRQYMSDELQALCFLAGANSIFIGDVLLTTKNPQTARDAVLLDRLGIKSKLDDATGAGAVMTEGSGAAT